MTRRPRPRPQIIIAVLVVLIGACGNGEPTYPGVREATYSPRTELPVDPVAVSAHAYAKEWSDLSDWGATEDHPILTHGLAWIQCSEAELGTESDGRPACIYHVAYTGCHDGLTGERLLGWDRPIEEEYADEPRLQEIYHQAAQDCSDND